MRLWDTGARHHGSDIGLGRKNNQMGKEEIVKEVIDKLRERKREKGEEKTFVQDDQRVEEQCATESRASLGTRIAPPPHRFLSKKAKKNTFIQNII